MENASKALIISASVLITVMILAFMMYMFRRMAVISQTTENRMTSQEIGAFNAQFMDYATIGAEKGYNNNIGFTILEERSASTFKEHNIKYKELFKAQSSYLRNKLL